MDNVIVSGIQFYSHFPRKIPKGTVNAEAVIIRLDSEWDGLTVRIHWLNVASGVEKVVLLERDQPNTIPWEVLDDLSELRMGLDGMDGGTIVKPTVWLTYGYVVDGVDPEAGDDPHPPTPSWEQQMVEQATQANQAAQEAKGYAQQVAESIESAGPYAEEAKEAAEAAKTSETAAKGAADTATQQATKAQEAVASIGDAVQQAQQAATDAGAAKSAAETAQAVAAQSAGEAQTAAGTAAQAAKEAQSAATQAGEYLDGVNAAAGAATNAAIAAGKSQEAAATSAQQASVAAQTAQEAAGSIGDAVEQAQSAATAAGSAQRAAETAQGAAAQSAGIAQTSAGTATQAAQEANSAATQAGEYLDGVNAAAGAATDAAIAASKSQEAAQSAAQEAANARDQANTAATTAQGHASAATTAKDVAEQAAANAGNAQAGAAQSAQTAASSASAAQAAQQAAEAAAAVLPTPTQEEAGKFLAADAEGKQIKFVPAPDGGGAGGELLLAEYIHQGNQEIHFSSFDWESGTGECTEPHGFTAAKKVMLVPDDWKDSGIDGLFKYAPVEWELYAGSIYLLPINDTSVVVVGNDKSTPIEVDQAGQYNSSIDFTKIHFEVPTSWNIANFPVNPLAIRLVISGYMLSYSYRYMYLSTTLDSRATLVGPLNMPAFGVLSKPYHMIYSFWDICFTASRYGAGSYSGTIRMYGRRNNIIGSVGESGTQNIIGNLLYVDKQKQRKFSALSNPSGYGFLSNESIIQIYAKGVDQE